VRLRQAEELLSPVVAWEASVVRGTKMRVWVQIGPVFIGSVEKVSGGHVCHRPCCREARRLLRLGGGVVVGVGALFSSGPNRRR
jgi:hypothetical protein